MNPIPLDLKSHLQSLHESVEKLIQVRGWMQSGWQEHKLDKFTDKKLRSIHSHLQDILDYYKQ